MEQDGLIHVLREVDRRKIYQITDAGKKVLYAEMDRLDDILRLAVRITGDAGLGSAKKEEMRCC
jgi:DNA-binding PadR family transcriptional regulator